ncbi:hypothetical protein IPG36_02675 [bacterium]|nr:MAG: hypothetical protein IPG36_02675 [bacterium]
MKRRDLVYLLLAATIFIIAGYVAYTQLNPNQTTKKDGVDVERVGQIPATLDGTGLQALQGKDGNHKTQDYNPVVELSGLGNKAPFGQ